jgi:sugar/nucleoside kinase (ribokinase family)
MIQVEEDERSSYTIALSPENSDRIFLHCTGTNDTFGLGDIDFEAVKGAKIFHFGYPPLMPRMYLDGGEELGEIFRRARGAGAVTSMDTAQPDPNKASGQVNWAEILPRLLPHVDIFVPSIEEIVFMLRRDDFDTWGGDILKHISRDYLRELADELIEMGAAITGFKLSYYGLYLRASPERERMQMIGEALPLDLDAWTGAEAYHPAFKTQVVGTTGAGDSTYAALLVALVKGLSPDEAVKMACAVGASNVEAPGAVDGLHSWEEIARRVDDGWETRTDVIE